MKIRKLENINYKILKDFDISFLKGNFENNLIVLAGTNGTGKTTILEFIYNKMHNNQYELNGDLYFEYQMDKLLHKNIHTFKTFYPDIINKIKTNIHYLKAKDNQINNLKKEIVEYIKNLIFENEIAPRDAYAQFNKFLQDVFNGMELSISFSGLDKNENIYFKNSFDDKVSIDNLSTGEKEILSKVFYFFIKDIKDSIILIDEPEISLHPTWQSLILKVYKNLADKFNNQVIIATHSPQIIMSTPKDSLRVLVKEENIVSKNINSFGKDIHTILLEIMGASYLRDMEIEHQITKVKNMVFENNYKSELFDIEFDKLENMLIDDNIELSLIKLQMKQQDVKNSKI